MIHLLAVLLTRLAPTVPDVPENAVTNSGEVVTNNGETVTHSG